MISLDELKRQITYLGLFLSAELAAQAYEDAAIRFYGEYVP